MTRKDYELIAAAIREQVLRLKPELAAGLALAAVKGTAMTIALALARDNPRFDRARFLSACGFDD